MFPTRAFALSRLLHSAPSCSPKCLKTRAAVLSFSTVVHPALLPSPGHFRGHRRRIMARRPRAARLETRTARLKLKVRKKPYDFTSIAPRIRLGYRRCKSAGRWVVKVADGHGGNWTKVVGIADDTRMPTASTCSRGGRRRTRPARSHAAR